MSLLVIFALLFACSANHEATQSTSSDLTQDGGAIGAACDNDAGESCSTDLVCFESHCVLYSASGYCDGQYYLCNAGLICDDNSCQPPSVSSLGGSCDGVATICQTGLECYEGTCVQTAIVIEDIGGMCGITQPSSSNNYTLTTYECINGLACDEYQHSSKGYKNGYNAATKCGVPALSKQSICEGMPDYHTCEITLHCEWFKRYNTMKCIE